MSYEDIGSAVEEFKKFMEWMLNADPINSLQIAAVTRMNPTAKYLIQRGIDVVMAIKHALEECKGKRGEAKEKCVRDVIERRTGMDYETAMNAVKNFSTLATSIRTLSPTAQEFVQRVSRYILLGEKREIQFNIGGWMGSGGYSPVAFGRKGGEEEE